MRRQEVAYPQGVVTHDIAGDQEKCSIRRIFGEGKDLSSDFRRGAGMGSQLVVLPKPPERREELRGGTEPVTELARPRVGLLDLRGTPSLNRHEGGSERHLDIELVPKAGRILRDPGQRVETFPEMSGRFDVR